MSERKSATKKKNRNRVKASERPFHSSTQHSYYKPVVKVELTKSLF